MKTASIFKLVESIDLSKIDSMPHTEEPHPFSMGGLGRINLGDKSSMPVGNSGAWYRFREFTKKIPKSAIDRALADRVTEDMDKGQRDQIRYEVMGELAANMPMAHRDFDVAITQDYIIIGAGRAKAEEITGVIRKSTGSLALQPYPLGLDLRQCVMPMINTGELCVDSLTLEGDLRADFGQDGMITLKACSFDSDLLSILQQCLSIKHVRLGWGDVVATIKPDASLNSISTDLDIIHGETDYDGDYYLHRLAEVDYLSKQLPKMLGDLALHGGAQ